MADGKEQSPLEQFEIKLEMGSTSLSGMAKQTFLQPTAFLGKGRLMEPIPRTSKAQTG